MAIADLHSSSPRVLLPKPKFLGCRPDWVIDQTFDLFVELGANDEQCDFPVVYASGVNGTAGQAPEEMSENLEPLFEAVVREASPASPACFLLGPEQSRQPFVSCSNFSVARFLELQAACLALQVSPPVVGTSSSLQMMVSNLDYDTHKGRLAIGRVTSGRLQKGQTVAIAKPGRQLQDLLLSLRSDLFIGKLPVYEGC